MADQVYAAFERDIPEPLRDDAMQMMAEAAHDDDAHDAVYILERDRLDAINVRVHGIIAIAGKEFTFQLEDGNRNGTELLSWDDDRAFERHVPTQWALQPDSGLVDAVIMDGKGPFLLLKWDDMLANRPELAALPGKYSYDRTFAPGTVTESYWRNLAAKHRFEIVTKETSDETRARLSPSSRNDLSGVAL